MDIIINNNNGITINNNEYTINNDVKSLEPLLESLLEFHILYNLWITLIWNANSLMNIQ